VLDLLSNIVCNELQTYGGKACMLALMTSKSISVPKGIAIGTDEFFAVINHQAIKETVNSFWNPKSAEDMILDSKRIKDFVTNFDISLLAKKVRQELKELFPDDAKLIFRSSATSEDGNMFSFAGQFLSEKGNINDIECRIKAIWCSAFEQNVNDYVRNMGDVHISIDRLGMGIVIQQFCDFDVSGVLFSKHPTINIKNWLLIEYSDRPLEEIVHGEIIPIRARINVANKKVLYENKKYIALNDEIIDKMIAFTNILLGEMKCEIDVEWGVVKGDLIFVQCRPITTF